MKNMTAMEICFAQFKCKKIIILQFAHCCFLFFSIVYSIVFGQLNEFLYVLYISQYELVS